MANSDPREAAPELHRTSREAKIIATTPSTANSAWRWTSV